MSVKLDLPDGAWGLLRDPAKVPERLRRPVTNLASDLQPEIRAASSNDEATLTAEVLGRFQALNDLVIVAMVAEWSFDMAISVESVGDLPGDAYDILRRETAKHVNELLPDFSPNPDPKVLTGP